MMPKIKERGALKNILNDIGGFLSFSKPTPALEKILVDELYRPFRGGDFYFLCAQYKLTFE